MLDPAAIERGSATDQTMHFVPLLEKKFRKVRTILTCYACNQSFFLRAIGDDNSKGLGNCLRVSSLRVYELTRNS